MDMIAEQARLDQQMTAIRELDMLMQRRETAGAFFTLGLFIGIVGTLITKWVKR